MKAELHCHSRYSQDCEVSLEKIIALCQERSIDCIALTDHNEIAGAERLKELAPSWLKVIVGEEVASREGDVIGLFLKERIPARLPIEETIARIHGQGGLALLPHPFDRLRKEAVGAEVAEAVAGLIDAVEVFNSRCVFPGDNRRASAFAGQHGLIGFAGSDAHTPLEYGRSGVRLEAFESPQEFLDQLSRARLTKRYSIPWVHVETKLVKLRKRSQELG